MASIKKSACLAMIGLVFLVVTLFAHAAIGYAYAPSWFWHHPGPSTISVVMRQEVWTGPSDGSGNVLDVKKSKFIGVLNLGESTRNEGDSPFYYAVATSEDHPITGGRCQSWKKMLVGADGSMSARIDGWIVRYAPVPPSNEAGVEKSRPVQMGGYKLTVESLDGSSHYEARAKEPPGGLRANLAYLPACMSQLLSANS